MRNAELYVVDHRRQRVEIAAVLADQHGVGDRGEIDRLMSAHQIVPIYIRTARRERIAVEIRQEEAPMRFAAFGLELCPIRLAEPQRLAAIDRRQPPRKQDLALELQLPRRFVAWVEHAARF